jgi:hypothetical protein
MNTEGPTAHKIPLVFYRTASGNEPVRDWLRDLDRDDRLARERMKEIQNG